MRDSTPEQIADFLRPLLRKHGGRIPAAEATEAIHRQFGEVPRQRVVRARKRAGISTRRVGQPGTPEAGWLWYVPKKEKP